MLKITDLKQLNKGLSAAKSFAGKVAAAAAEAIAEVDDKKSDKPHAVAVTIPTTGWKSDSTADYPYYYDIPCSGITAADRADVAVAPTGVKTASACGMCPTTETRSGVIRIRAEKTPASAVSANYWVIGGK